MDVIEFLLLLVATVSAPVLVASAILAWWRRRRVARDEPVLDQIARFEWRDNWREIAYRDELARDIHIQLDTSQRREEPLRTGTRIDLTLWFQQVEFYVTIKRNIDNQARLTLQGEAEDIVAECRARRGNGKVTIIVIVGMPSDVDEADVMPHIDALSLHLQRRMAAVNAVTDHFRFQSYVVCIPMTPSAATVTTQCSRPGALIA